MVKFEELLPSFGCCISEFLCLDLIMRYCNHIMIIKDEGYVLSAKKYGEKALIVTLLTKSKGKIAGFVSEGAEKKKRGLFQPGNKLFFEASARLEENMRRLLFCLI